MPKILSKMNSFVACGEYENAMAALAVVPVNIDEYETVYAPWCRFTINCSKTR